MTDSARPDAELHTLEAGASDPVTIPEAALARAHAVGIRACNWPALTQEISLDILKNYLPAAAAALASSAGPVPDEVRQLSEAATELLNACVEDMGLDSDDGDDEPVGLSLEGPTAVRFGHLRRLQAAIAGTMPAKHPIDALVDRFASALSVRLALSSGKPGRGDFWQSSGWREMCQLELVRHVAKGDPLDVAAYAAFCWHHGWKTAAAPEPAAGGGREAWMQTFRLPYFRVLDPRPDDILIEDIAHHLAQAVRYGGAGIRWLSVAEHSVRLARAAEPEHKLWALLHDAPEAYLHDVVRPVKRTLVGYKEAEDRLMQAICQRFGLPLEMPREVKRLDNRICIDERAQNMPPSDVVWAYGGETEPLGITLEYWTPERAEREFLTTFAELTGHPVEMPAITAPAHGSAGGEGWRFDMEAAPKDGTPVLVAVEGRDGKPPIVGEAYVDADNGGAWWWANEGDGDYHASPIHELLSHPYAWKPLDKAPPKPTPATSSTPAEGK